MHELLIVLHVGAGGVGLLAGPLAALARRKARGLHTAAGWTYQLCVLILCTTTFALVVHDPSLWPFALIAAATQGAAAGSVVVRRRRRPGWLPMHVQLALGSYVSFVTAFSVQTVGGLASWLVPSTVGTVVVSLVTARVSAPVSGRRRAPRAA